MFEHEHTTDLEKCATQLQQQADLDYGVTDELTLDLIPVLDGLVDLEWQMVIAHWS